MHPLPSPIQNLDGTIFGKVVDAPLFCTGKKGKGESAAIFITFVEEKGNKRNTHATTDLFPDLGAHKQR